MQYKLIQKDKNLGQTIIEKTGHSHTFSVLEVVEHILQLKNKMKEFVAQDKFEKTKMTNIEEHNDFLKGLTDEQKHAVWLWYESKKISNICQEGLKTHQDALDEYDEVIKEVKKQTGYSIKVPLAIWKSNKKK